MATITSHNFFEENISTIPLWVEDEEQVHRLPLTRGLVQRTDTGSNWLRSGGIPARSERQARSWLSKLYNLLGSWGQADPMTWECHMLSSQEPSLLKRKSVPESALWASSTNIARGQPMTWLVTPSSLVIPLLSKHSTVLLVTYTSFPQRRKKHGWIWAAFLAHVITHLKI